MAFFEKKRPYPFHKKKSKEPVAESVYAGPAQMAAMRGPGSAPMEEVYAGPPEPDPMEAAPVERPEEPMKRVYAGPMPMAMRDDPARMGAVYAGPEPAKAVSVREEAEKRLEQNQIEGLKAGIREMSRYRSVTLPEDMDSMSLDELQELYHRIVELPQTVFIDELPRNPDFIEPPVMMVYAGPQQMQNGGIFQFPIGMMQNSMQQASFPEDRDSVSQEPVGECPHCRSKLMSWSKFCPECGGILETLPTCPICGAKVAEGVKFCHECGARLDQQ